MVTCLVAGSGVPLWDRNLVQIIQEVAVGPAGGAPDRTIEVSESGQTAYRTIIANGEREFDALPDRMAELGFQIRINADVASVMLPELAAAALKAR